MTANIRRKAPQGRPDRRSIKGKRARHDPLFALFDAIRQDNPAAYKELVRLFEDDQK